MKIRYAILLILAAFMVGILTEFLCGLYRGKNEPQITNQRDTLIVRDTVELEVPVPVSKAVRDSIPVPVRDTVVINDTVYLELPREVVTYSHDEYYAVVSGYEPKLEKIKVYPVTVYVKDTQTCTEVKGRSRLGFSVTAGPGAFVDLKGQPYLGGGVVAGVSWRF